MWSWDLLLGWLGCRVPVQPWNVLARFAAAQLHSLQRWRLPRFSRPNSVPTVHARRLLLCRFNHSTTVSTGRARTHVK